MVSGKGKKKQHRRVTVLPFPGFNSGIWGQCACNSTLRCGRSGVVERFCVQEIAMQAASSGIGYGLKYQARCISDVKADTDHTSFLAGTLSLKEENEVHLIRLSSNGTELFCEGLFSHPNEIWDLVSCPFDQRIFSTVYSNGETYGAAIWQIPELYGELNSPQLERITSLDTDSGKIKCILWWPSGRHDKLISINEENMYLWNLDVSKKTAQVQSQDSAGMLHKLSGGAWDPHDVSSVVATCESYLQFWDVRTMKKSISVECSHVCSVDYHPQKQHILVTAEHESGIHIWDVRKPKVPIQELPGHTHWYLAWRGLSSVIQSMME
ncbi:WD repeat-containing protein DWA2-like isoform X2 [Phaseolus vulgaris]|uniref:WD repeat-containing protein DWA2-like isoform X2 n=1 Tax=Phaseolus vulgaris TaxID=3885 RepID=UPI0035CBADCE